MKRADIIILGISAVAAAILVGQLNSGRRAEAEARRLAEAEVLRQRGLAVAAQADARGMREALAVVVATSEELAAELEKVKRSAPGARPVSVMRASTGPTPAAGAARPTEPPPSSGRAPPAAPSCSCLLAEGDTGEIRVESATLETRAGNRVLAGAASAWRLSPEPATRLFGGPLRGDVTVERAPGTPGWGWGLAGSVGGDGWQAGVAVSPPPRRLWGWQGELVLSGVAGPTGGWSAGATAIVRRR